MMKPAAQAKKLAVQHVREPRDGKPVGGFAGSQRPFETRLREAATDMGVAGHILGIVEIDEVKTRDGSIQRYRRDKNGQRDPQVEPGIARWPYQGKLNVRFLPAVFQNETFTPSCRARPPPVPLTPVPLPMVEVT